MSRSRVLLIVVALLAIPAAAATTTRIRLENTSNPGSRVTITFAESSRPPAQLELNEDGTARLVVEAPSPRLRLRGGSLKTDPMIDALARQQLRASSASPVLLTMNSSEQPTYFAPADGPLVYDDWGYYGGYPGSYLGYSADYWGGATWRESCCRGGEHHRLLDIPVYREIPPDRTPVRPRSGGTFSTRGVMPRYGGRR